MSPTIAELIAYGCFAVAGVLAAAGVVIAQWKQDKQKERE